MLFLLLWFYTCIILEKVDPLQGGYFRRKYRRDRRPTLPRENPLVFYPRFAAEVIAKHIRLAVMTWELYRLRRELKRDPDARNYTDAALTPDSETELESLDLFKIVAR